MAFLFPFGMRLDSLACDCLFSQVLSIVNVQGFALKYVSHRLRKDRDVVAAALVTEPLARKYSLLEKGVLQHLKNTLDLPQRKLDPILKRDCWVGGAGSNISSEAYLRRKMSASGRSDSEEEAILQQIWNSPHWTGPRDENYRYESHNDIEQLP